MKYLLPCTCGQSIVVDVGQAGQMVTCSCGQQQEAPTMRGIRALAPATEENARDAAGRQPAASWSPLQGGLFAIGMLLALAGFAAAGYYGYQIQRIDVPVPTEEDFVRDANQIEKMPIDEVYEGYLKVREMGLGPAELPMYAIAQRVEAIFLKYTIAGSIAAAIGIAMIIASFVLGKRSPHAPS